MSAPADGATKAGLSGLDWFVILAACAALVGLVVWLIQGNDIPGTGTVPAVPAE